MDGLDFFPTSQLVEGCSPFVIRNLAAQFWNAEVDRSCEEANTEDRKKCLVFTTSHQYIETPFMVVVPYQDTNKQVLLLTKLMNSILLLVGARNILPEEFIYWIILLWI